eukprot:g11846.t1
MTTSADSTARFAPFATVPFEESLQAEADDRPSIFAHVRQVLEEEDQQVLLNAAAAAPVKKEKEKHEGSYPVAPLNSQELPFIQSCWEEALTDCSVMPQLVPSSLPWANLCQISSPRRICELGLLA